MRILTSRERSDLLRGTDKEYTAEITYEDGDLMYLTIICYGATRAKAKNAVKKKLQNLKELLMTEIDTKELERIENNENNSRS